MAAGDFAFVGVRLWALDPGPPIAYCEDGRCGAQPPLLASLVREDESTYAGIALMSFLGGVLPEERPQIERSAPEKYGRLDQLRGGRPGANLLLVSSSVRRVRSVAWLPPGEDPVPGIVFLHGFGGGLTAYLSTLLEDERLARYAVIAPALDWEGRWWGEEGRGVVARTLETLPARVDRERLVLVGLSNGAVGVVSVAADPALGPRFQAFVALEGLAGPASFWVPRGPLLAVAARDDARFSLKGMQTAAQELRESGVSVTLVEVDGDHMAFYTQTRAMTEAVADFLGALP
jgi:pimeloyl-ACP methyl ester carboxylesterase